MKTVAKASIVVTLLFATGVAFATDVWAQAAAPVAPTLIPVSGRLVNPDGLPRAGETVTLVISLYNTQTDPAPRWIEQQAVTLDATGGYTVQFGSTLPDGLPADLFATEGGARWLGVAVREAQGDVEQPRVMLVSVPYAAKAATAETLGGKSVSDFVLSSTLRDDLRTVLEEEGVTSSGGDVSAAFVADALQKATGVGTNLIDSAVYEVGGRVGIGTTSPGQALHLSGIGGLGNLGFDFQNTGTGGKEWILYSTNNSSALGGGKLVFRNATDGTHPFALTSSGAVGIGTYSPGQMLHVSGLGGLGNLGFELENIGPGGKEWIVYATANSSAFGGGRLIFRNASDGTNPMTFTASGDVGIGTTSPTAKLNVAGDTAVVGSITATGTISGGNVIAKYQDVAEWVDAAEPLDPGSLVVIDTTAVNRVALTSKAYDTRVAGAVSPQPGLILGEPGEGRVLVAQSGRVRVKADASFGAINPGDILVTSPTRGHAMKAKSNKVKPGTVVGKALEGLSKGKGEILVLLTLQ